MCEEKTEAQMKIDIYRKLRDQIDENLSGEDYATLSKRLYAFIENL